MFARWHDLFGRGGVLNPMFQTVKIYPFQLLDFAVMKRKIVIAVVFIEKNVAELFLRFAKMMIRKNVVKFIALNF
jgi:hypothetical protein